MEIFGIYFFTEMFIKFYKAFVQIIEFDWLPGRQKGLIFNKNVKKILLSETIQWMKLILCVHVYDTSIYLDCIVYSSWIRALVAMATYSFHRLIMGKLEINNFFYLNGDIWILFTEMFIE